MNQNVFPNIKLTTCCGSRAHVRVTRKIEKIDEFNHFMFALRH